MSNFCAAWLREQGDIYQSNALADDVKFGERLHICADEIDRLEGLLTSPKHNRDCEYVTSDGPAPCTCALERQEQR